MTGITCFKEIDMNKVYILCRDTFQYEDGGLSIEGVFSSPDLAISAGNEMLIEGKSGHTFQSIDDEPRCDYYYFKIVVEHLDGK